MYWVIEVYVCVYIVDSRNGYHEINAAEFLPPVERNGIDGC
jgi:hypothetical protein